MLYARKATAACSSILPLRAAERTFLEFSLALDARADWHVRCGARERRQSDAEMLIYNYSALLCVVAFSSHNCFMFV